MQDPFTGQSTCIQGGRLPSAEDWRALQHDHGRRLEALARFRTAAAAVGIGTYPDDDLVLWDADEVGLLALADPLWRELDAAAAAFRATFPLVELEDFGFPEDVEDLLGECSPRLRPISSGVEATAFEAEDKSIYKFFMPRDDGHIGGTFSFERGDEVALQADASDGTYQAMLEKFDLIMRLGGMPTEVIGVTKREGVLITKQTLGGLLDEGADTSGVQPRDLIPLPSRFLRAHRDHPRLYFVEDTPWLVADLHSKNLVRAQDGQLRAIDLLAAPLPLDLVAREPLLDDWLRRVRADPTADVLHHVSDDEL
ncbi:hypothetical protein [Synoicihabitans lomoniglobus]|uniref:Uncharacterized protein n=1 Tax=Synoicihabitans lomoniglobus TaxID=2909285 RepID=A0AAE9ZYD4_9BACT|nr:hypothetical protein [Opitutaceae bacterium LMO-M01]WED64853.1 hypothetical protein PXH66_21110 [Opitutaceae bacterium LMO-M01]